MKKQEFYVYSVIITMIYNNDLISYLIKGPDTQRKFVHNNTNERRRLCADDVQLSYQLPGKGTVIYWVANVSSSNFNINKVIAKSVSGE